MLVHERMSRNLITVSPDTTVPKALRLMKEKKVRRFPVVNAQGKLVGIVSDKDLLNAAPSPATTLAVWEIPELLARIRVEHVMTHNTITVTADTPLEEAARTMADCKIGGLPVMQGGALVGIITETDLFKSLLEMLGGRRAGVRVAVSVEDAKGQLAKVTEAIFGVSGDIVGLGIRELPETVDGQWELMFKVQDVGQEELVAALKPLITAVLDVREIDHDS
ncbi:MAG: CBS domain-containing protein [Chloroflexota bacterium]